MIGIGTNIFTTDVCMQTTSHNAHVYTYMGAVRVRMHDICPSQEEAVIDLFLCIKYNATS